MKGLMITVDRSYYGINLNKINSNLRKEIAINPKCTDADIVAWS